MKTEDVVPCGDCRKPRPLDDLLDALADSGAFAVKFLMCPTCAEASQRRAAFHVVGGKGWSPEELAGR